MADMKPPTPHLFIPPSKERWDRTRAWAVFGVVALPCILGMVMFELLMDWTVSIANPDVNVAFHTLAMQRAEIFLGAIGLPMMTLFILLGIFGAVALVIFAIRAVVLTAFKREMRPLVVTTEANPVGDV